MTKAATPEQRPERVTCISRRRSPWPQLSRTWSRSRWSRIEFSVRSIEATAAVDRARRVQLIELAVCGRCPAKLLFLPAVTGHTWCENTTQKSSKNGGGGYYQDSEGLATSFWFGGGGQTITWFFIFFHTFLPWVFRRRLFTEFWVSRYPFCVGKNNGGHQERSRKYMGEPRTAEWWPRRVDRGQLSWPIQAAKLVEATFSSWACSWETRWLFCRLLTGGLTIRRQTAALREILASDVGTDHQKTFFVEW